MFTMSLEMLHLSSRKVGEGSRLRVMQKTTTTIVHVFVFVYRRIRTSRPKTTIKFGAVSNT